MTRAAVALLIDQSFSMVVNDTWRDAKTMALALHTLASTAYPLDALQIISFANVARVVHPHELPNLEASYVQGTNLQHALLLAGQFLDRHPGSQRIVMVVTDGEPTAHLLPNGEGWFTWPPSHETISGDGRAGRSHDAPPGAHLLVPAGRRPGPGALPRRHGPAQRRTRAGGVR